jgi:hypothetical protein
VLRSRLEVERAGGRLAAGIWASGGTGSGIPGVFCFLFTSMTWSPRERGAGGHHRANFELNVRGPVTFVFAEARTKLYHCTSTALTAATQR